MKELLVKIYNRLDPRFQAWVNGLRYRSDYKEWRRDPKGRERVSRKISRLKGAFKGRRCVIIGNGPSINRMDLSVLKDEYTIGMNRIYLKFSEWGFETDVLACVNGTVITQFWDDFLKLKTIKFFNWRHARGMGDDDRTLLLASRPGLDPKGNLEEGLYNSGYTVTNTCLEIAYYLGFSEVILIGVDHSYVHPKGHGGKTVVSDGDDPNHFDKSYFGKGVTWQLPNLDGSEYVFARMRELFEADGRRIVDATLDGKLQIFEKTNLSEVLKDSGFQSKSEGGPDLVLE
ncbi:MAG: DUF115 domain-containing protein [Verrucomicrobiales bacterium]|nr:DUF115 domain-containing protein [Verrucomicrobiales bacterium]